MNTLLPARRQPTAAVHVMLLYLLLLLVQVTCQEARALQLQETTAVTAFALLTLAAATFLNAAHHCPSIIACAAVLSLGSCFVILPVAKQNPTEGEGLLDVPQSRSDLQQQQQQP